MLVCQHANIKLEGFSLGETPETLLLTADIKAVSKPWRAATTLHTRALVA